MSGGAPKALPPDTLAKMDTADLFALREAYEVSIERIDEQPDLTPAQVQAKAHARNQYVIAVAHIITILTERGAA